MKNGLPIGVLLFLLALPVAAEHECIPRTLACNSSDQGQVTIFDCSAAGGTYFDIWNFTGLAGQSFSLTMTSTSAIDPYLLVLDGNGSDAGQDDDSGPGNAAQVTGVFNGSGQYTAGASGTPGAQQTGSYSIALTCGGVGTSSCTPSPTAMCLLNDRFRIEASFQTATGQTGAAQMVKLTEDSGYMWFFNAANIEAVVKVLNGCPLNQRFWVFAGGLTDVRVEVTVTDTAKGATRTYINPQGAAFQPIQDTSAFATCP